LARIQCLIEGEGKPELNFRIYILGGGCSGFQYGFSFDAEIREDDQVIKQGTVSTVVDS
jgi:iron-sulfur cluster insertion protein